MQPELIIFDCDGTLVDSELLCNQGVAIMLEEYGIDCDPVQLMCKFRGWKLAKMLQAVEKQYGVSLEDDFVRRYRVVVDDLFAEQLKPCPGVADTLPGLQLPVCVASSGPLEKIQRALQITGLAGYFNSHLFSAYDIGSWKPEPGIFLHAAAAMGYAPQQCLVVEDSLPGIQAAQAAGMPAVLYDPHCLTEDVADLPVLQVIRDMSELTGLLSA